MYAALLAAAIFTVSAPSGAVYSADTRELAHWTDVARTVGYGPGAREAAFKMLITFNWIEAEAAEQGIVVTREEVTRELGLERGQAFRNARDFHRFLRETHQTVGDIRRRVRLDLLTRQIRQRIFDAAEASVTDADIDRYLDRTGGNVRVPERRIVRIVRFRTRSAALAARHALATGTSWKTIALDRFDGQRRRIVRGMLEPRLQRRVFRAARGRTVGPVHTRSGYYLFRVSRIKPAREHTRGRSRKIVRPIVVSDAQADALDAFVKDFNARWRSRTTCAPKYAAYPDCVKR